MKIRSLLLGSVAIAGLTTAGYAADLGVVTSLDLCDELGLSGLHISSDDNCLVITGNVAMEYNVGDYAPGVTFADFDRSGGTWDVIDNNGVLDADLDIDAWLKFAGTADTDFGPAVATIKLMTEDYAGVGDAPVKMALANVHIGDTTVIMAGIDDSIFKDGDDKPLNGLGLFNSSDVDAGVGFSDAKPATGGVIFDVVSNLGNGVSIGGGIENLHTGVGGSLLTGVGVLSYAGDGVTAHASGAIDNLGAWKFHTGFAGTWDPISVVAAVSGNKDAALVGGMYLNALASASVTFDMFTLAASGEWTNQGEWGAGGSVAATVTDGVSLNLAGRWFQDTTAAPFTVWQVEAGVSAAVTETITLSAAVGAEDSSKPATPLTEYVWAKGEWNPGGGAKFSAKGQINTLGGYKATLTAEKSIK